jgi:hypothetical protein
VLAGNREHAAAPEEVCGAAAAAVPSVGLEVAGACGCRRGALSRYAAFIRGMFCCF